MIDWRSSEPRPPKAGRGRAERSDGPGEGIQWYLISHSRPHSPSEAGRKTPRLAFVTRRVTATIVTNRVPLGGRPHPVNSGFALDSGAVSGASGRT